MTFEDKLRNYAKLIVHVGVNVQKGQRVLLRSAVESASLARLVVEEAYKAGASYVDTIWNDDAVTLARFQHAPDGTFEIFPDWYADAMINAANRGDAIISIRSSDPELLAGQDEEKVALVERVQRAELRAFSERIMDSSISWTLVSAPIPGWANKVFPDDDPQTQLSKLWDAVFKAVRADTKDPVGEWQTHLKVLEDRRAYLNNKQFHALKYTGPGTDLTVGLADNHVWLGGVQPTKDGVIYVANLPTEEVFTMPHRARVDGVIKNSLPLSYTGTLIDDFELTFENGKVVKARAGKGEKTLKRLLESDEGASRLGEVALVPHSSPISQTGTLFYNTLYDENAASHLALGRAYRFTIEGGSDMSADEAEAHGANDSLSHVDFMVGSNELDIDGVHKDGTTEPVMRKGEWAF